MVGTLEAQVAQQPEVLEAFFDVASLKRPKIAKWEDLRGFRELYAECFKKALQKVHPLNFSPCFLAVF